MSTYTVRYPSGKSLSLSGIFRSIDFGDHGVLPCIESPAGQIVVLDPRGIVAAGRRVVYRPRRSPAGLPAWAAEWLHGHPEWDACAGATR